MQSCIWSRPNSHIACNTEVRPERIIFHSQSVTWCLRMLLKLGFATNRRDTVWCVAATSASSSSKLVDQVSLTEHKTLACAFYIEAEIPLQHLVFAIECFTE